MVEAGSVRVGEVVSGGGVEVGRVFEVVAGRLAGPRVRVNRQI